MSPLLADIAERLRSAQKVRAVVVGAGRSGRAAAELLASKGAEVGVLDDRVEALSALPEAWGRGAIEAGRLSEAELIVLSPGVPRGHSELAGALAAGRLIGEVELASWFSSLPTVGITGTNGKSTCTALVGEMLRAAGRRPYVGGNFGPPACALPTRSDEYDVAVLELSSYQLESVVSFAVDVGVWLNLQPDHLDRYPSFEAYGDAKARLLETVRPDGKMVLSATDPVVRARGQGWTRASTGARWFAADAERSAPGPGTFARGPLAEREGVAYRLDGPGLLGRHNRENAVAAVEAACSLGCPPDAVQTALSSFDGLPHRLSLVHQANGVRWYDDSKATNVASAVTAVRAMERPTVLVAGGLDKGGAWTPLVEASRTNIRLVLAIGSAQEIVRKAFDGVVPVEVVDTLDRAVHRAREAVRPGQDVLLAPACASFDQFQSYVARGERFVALAREESEP